MDLTRCKGCKRKLKKCTQANQQYCSSVECQRERRRRWQQAKRNSDPDYRDNQLRAQQAWLKRNSSYWSEYRSAHPEYRERNRKLQYERNSKRKKNEIAKMDAPSPKNQVSSGTYLLTPVRGKSIAKMNAWTVELLVISNHCDETEEEIEDCKERTS